MSWDGMSCDVVRDVICDVMCMCMCCACDVHVHVHVRAHPSCVFVSIM